MINSEICQIRKKEPSILHIIAFITTHISCCRKESLLSHHMD